VDALSVEVRTGEVFGLLGRNGAGKSSLIKMLTTLLPPVSRSAHIAGFDLVREAASVRGAIGYVPPDALTLRTVHLAHASPKPREGLARPEPTIRVVQRDVRIRDCGPCP
jgi:ABC-type uncharacterized transport system ATPase subunit